MSWRGLMLLKRAGLDPGDRDAVGWGGAELPLDFAWPGDEFDRGIRGAADQFQVHVRESGLWRCGRAEVCNRLVEFDLLGNGEVLPHDRVPEDGPGAWFQAGRGDRLGGGFWPQLDRDLGG